MKYIVTITQKFETSIDVVIEAKDEIIAQREAKRLDDEKRFQSLWDAVNAKQSKHFVAVKGENP